MRSDYSEMDPYYVMPNGKHAKCAGDVDKFLEANPEYKNRMSASDFSFAPLKVVEETVPRNSGRKAAKAKKQKARHKSDWCSELCLWLGDSPLRIMSHPI